MEIIKKLADMISDEINDAGKYAECALQNKESDPALADVFYRLSREETTHMNLLHDQATRIIEAHQNMYKG